MFDVLLAQITTSAPAGLTFREWAGIVIAIVAQTLTLGGLLWKIATKAAKMETTLEIINNKLLHDHDERLKRLEQAYFNSGRGVD